MEFVLSVERITIVPHILSDILQLYTKEFRHPLELHVEVGDGKITAETMFPGVPVNEDNGRFTT